MDRRGGVGIAVELTVMLKMLRLKASWKYSNSHLLGVQRHAGQLCPPLPSATHSEKPLYFVNEFA